MNVLHSKYKIITSTNKLKELLLLLSDKINLKLQKICQLFGKPGNLNLILLVNEPELMVFLCWLLHFIFFDSLLPKFPHFSKHPNILTLYIHGYPGEIS